MLFRTFSALGDKDQILAKLEDVATELEHDLEQGGWTGKTVTLKYKLDTYQGRTPSSVASPLDLQSRLHAVFTRAKSFDRWISTKKEDLFAVRTSRSRLANVLTQFVSRSERNCYSQNSH